MCSPTTLDPSTSCDEPRAYQNKAQGNSGEHRLLASTSGLKHLQHLKRNGIGSELSGSGRRQIGHTGGRRVMLSDCPVGRLFGQTSNNVRAGQSLRRRFARPVETLGCLCRIDGHGAQMSSWPSSGNRLGERRRLRRLQRSWFATEIRLRKRLEPRICGGIFVRKSSVRGGERFDLLALLQRVFVAIPCQNARCFGGSCRDDSQVA